MGFLFIFQDYINTGGIGLPIILPIIPHFPLIVKTRVAIA
jgi:hypothetical protein